MTTEFTPLAALAGGAMIGVSAILLMALQGRLAGISGIAVRVFPPYLDRQAVGRIAFIAGLIAAPAIYASLAGGWPPMTITGNPTLLAAAGLLVGFGSIWGSGCTSGHGVCGLSRLSVRSMAAVAAFMTTAIITVFVTNHLS